MSIWDKFVEKWINASSMKFANDDYFDMVDLDEVVIKEN